MFERIALPTIFMTPASDPAEKSHACSYGGYGGYGEAVTARRLRRGVQARCNGEVSTARGLTARCSRRGVTARCSRRALAETAAETRPRSKAVICCCEREKSCAPPVTVMRTSGVGSTLPVR